MAELKIEMPETVDYEAEWADKLPEDKRVEIPSLEGGKEERESGR